MISLGNKLPNSDNPLITVNNFEEHIRGDKPVVIDFYAEWCQPCKMMEPILRQVKEKTGDRAIILKLNIDKSHHYSQLYCISFSIIT